MIYAFLDKSVNVFDLHIRTENHFTKLCFLIK